MAALPRGRPGRTVPKNVDKELNYVIDTAPIRDLLMVENLAEERNK